MHTITLRFKQPKIIVAVLALAALAVALLVTTMSVGATGGDLAGGSGNTYADPQPCGPGAGDAFMPEPHEITSGHFYLFDSYWEDTTATESGNGNTGLLHTNMCPPKWATTTKVDDYGRQTTVTGLTDSNIDVDEAIFHVQDKHKAKVVADAAGEAEGAKLRMDRYPSLGYQGWVQAGDHVWWLRLDDPDTEDVDEQSGLTLGFSTDRFDGDHWHRSGKDADDNPYKGAFRYMLEVEREDGVAPSQHPRLLAYKKRGADEGDKVTPAELVWDSAAVHTKSLDMEPGQLEDLQWIFTKAGTYTISVHAIGWVRETNPHQSGHDDYDPNWERISGKVTETSEVQRYTIQVGDLLDEEEPPVFGVSMSVPENSAAGTAVGGPIPVYRTESATLYYSLTGEDSRHFTAEALTEPHRVQIKVADGADLDFENRPTYDLTLGVSNRKDHEGNKDDVIDDELAVTIELTNETEVAVSANFYSTTFGDPVTWTATVQPLPDDATNVVYHWSVHGDYGGSEEPSWQDVSETGAQLTLTITENTVVPGASVYVKVRVSAAYTDGNGNKHNLPSVESGWEVEWRD